MGIATSLTLSALIGFIWLAASLTGHSRAVPQLAAHPLIFIIPGALVASLLLWQSRHLSSGSRVALWIEERVPGLQYALVTAMEHPASRFSYGMEDAVDHHEIARVTWFTVRRSVFRAAVALALSATLLFASTSRAIRSAVLQGAVIAPSADRASLGNRLEDLTARITPPFYARARTATLEDPSSIAALAGSRVVVTGHGASDGISVSLASSSQKVSESRGLWSVAVTMPTAPVALSFKDRQYDHIIVLDPIPDNPPKILLTSPIRDTTLRIPRLLTELKASATDDIGLDVGYFEYLISTGSGEVFSGRTITTPLVRFGGSRSGALSRRLNLADLNLKEGDVVSIRAITSDLNTLSGPGIATSDTRTFRIARAGEYDSLSVDGAPPPAIDSSAMSQRMIIMMTESLVKEQKKLTHAVLVKRSTEIGDLEDRIRKRVHEVLFEAQDLVGQEKPGDPPPDIEDMEPPDDVTEAKNPDLVIAYNALWQAVRSMEIAEPQPALSPMRVALKALERIRLANRYYLRGTPPKVVVDLARVRMAGKERGSSSVRTPRTKADSARTDLLRHFNDAIELIRTRPAETTRAFTLLQVEALSVSPPAAAALGDAVEAFRRGRDATLPILRARRALGVSPESSSGLPPWSR